MTIWLVTWVRIDAFVLVATPVCAAVTWLLLKSAKVRKFFDYKQGGDPDEESYQGNTETKKHAA